MTETKSTSQPHACTGYIEGLECGVCGRKSTDPKPEAPHFTRPAKQRMGQNTGECQTCGAPTILDRGIWKHDPKRVVRLKLDPTR